MNRPEPTSLHPAPSLSGPDIELSLSRGYLASIFEVALEDEDYRRYSNLPTDVASEEVASVRQRRSDAGDAAYWAVLAGDRQVCGIFELTFRDKAAGILEAGYWIAEPARGSGYATQALLTVTEWVKREAVGKRIELAIYPANEASIRVAEKAEYVDHGETTPSVPGAPRHEFPRLYIWNPTAD